MIGISLLLVAACSTQLNESNKNPVPTKSEKFFFDSSCGVFALYSLVKLEQPNLTWAEFEQKLPSSDPAGYSFEELQNTARKFGITLHAVRVNNNFVFLKPSIIYLERENIKHYVVAVPIPPTMKKLKIIDGLNPINIIETNDLYRNPAWKGLILYQHDENSGNIKYILSKIYFFVIILSFGLIVLASYKIRKLKSIKLESAPPHRA